LGWDVIVCTALSRADDTGLGTARLYVVVVVVVVVVVCVCVCGWWVVVFVWWWGVRCHRMVVEK